MLKKILCFILVFAAALLPALEIRGDWQIVSGAVNGANEKTARHYLRSFLIKMVGGTFRIVEEKNFDGKTKAIFFGDTAYARKHGIDQSKLNDELWLIKAMPDGNLIISGGKARGILYAVYEFAELAGARFLTANVRILPKLAGIKLSDSLNIRKEPFFVYRNVYTATSDYDFASWHKLNPNVRNMGFRIVGQSHSFSNYTRDFPEKKELYALNIHGRRVLARSHYEYGQVCLTHPEVRRLFKERLRANIAQEKINAAKKGAAPAKYYRITQNDNAGFCYCQSCKKAIEKYGTLSGLLLEFINDIAGDFPDINIITLAYNETLEPPKNGLIKAFPNVVVEIAQLAPDKRELLLPLSAKVNTEARERQKKWSEICRNICVWDYFKVYCQPHPSPYTALIALRENLPFYARNNVKWFFAESEFFGRYNVNDSHAFHDLEIYLAMKLLCDPFIDQDAVINDFMKHYYGPAARDMTEYLNYIIKRQKNSMPPGTYHRSFADSPHFDREFFAAAQKFLADALQKCAGTEYYDRVIYERVIVDSAQLYMYDKLARRSGPELPAKDVIMKRIYSESAKAVKRWKKPDGDIFRLHQMCAPEKLAVPKELIGKKVRYLISAGGRRMDDPDSPNGKTAYLDKKNLSANEKDIVFGVFDFEKRERLCKDLVIPAKDFPQDEKYHFYKIGTVKPRKKCYVFGHRSWRINYFFFNRVEEGDGDKIFDVWVSVKLTGPAYVKGSASASTFRVNQVLLVEK